MNTKASENSFKRRSKKEKKLEQSLRLRTDLEVEEKENLKCGRSPAEREETFLWSWVADQNENGRG